MKYVGKWTARDKTEYTIRPILPEDESLLVNFHKTLSERTVFMRYLQPMMLQDRVMHERLSRICHSDYDREITPLVVEGQNKEGQPSILGVGRLSKMHGTNEARFSVLISDPYQGIGIGGELLRRAVDVAKGGRSCKPSAPPSPPTTSPCANCSRRSASNSSPTAATSSSPPASNCKSQQPNCPGFTPRAVFNSTRAVWEGMFAYAASSAGASRVVISRIWGRTRPRPAPPGWSQCRQLPPRGPSRAVWQPRPTRRRPSRWRCR